MLKKIISLLMVLTLVMSFVLTGCTDSEENEEKNTPATTKADEKEEKEPASEVDTVKVGMVTDSGTIDDKSFNQGTWEGIEAYASDKGTIVAKYQQPEGSTETDYLNAISDLVDNGHEIIVTPGFKFETAIFAAQDQYPDTTFILIDGSPHDGNWPEPEFRTNENVVSIFFNEHEAGFLAGVAAALSSKTGKVGFVGGMEIPPVQKFGWGFAAGVKHANDTYGTSVEVANYIYEGSFDNLAGGTTLANGMYNDGVDIIFAAAGGVGVGVINEAKSRAAQGEEVFVVGVDVDQYADGIYDEANNKSCILTSAFKQVDVAAYDHIDAKLNGTFPGAQSVSMGLKEEAVGLPAENPNLSDDVIAKVEEAKAALLDGSVVAPASAEDIRAFLGDAFPVVK